MTIEVLTVEQEFVTLDLLLWRRFGFEVRGAHEKTLEANPGLAALHTPFLPVGLKVEVELQDPAASTPVVRVRRLWGG